MADVLGERDLSDGRASVIPPVDVALGHLEAFALRFAALEIGREGEPKLGVAEKPRFCERRATLATEDREAAAGCVIEASTTRRGSSRT